MRSLRSRALLILLLVAAAYPPPRMAGVLIEGAARDETAPARKIQQARGRNRVVSSARADVCRISARLDSGTRRTRGPSCFLARRPEPTAAAIAPDARPALVRAHLHLRC